MKEIRISVFDQEQYDGDWPPTDPEGFMSWWTTKLGGIPAEHRATARVEIDSVGSYEDSHYGHISISYWRQETASEQAARERQERSRQDERKAALRRELERLENAEGQPITR